MLQAFIDGSSGEGVLALAGYVAPRDVWQEFSREWAELLTVRPALSRFKMSEMHSSVERLERAEWFYRVIERHNVSPAISCIVKADELIKVVDTTDWPSWIEDTHLLKNPYFFGFKAIINVLNQYQEKLDLVGPIDFVFDDQSEKRRTLEAWDYLKLSVPRDIRKNMGAISYENDENQMPLQAADLYAWWIRKWYLDGIDDGVEHLKFPWKVEKDLKRIDMSFAESDFRK